jgi:hypothetical protein
MDHGFNAEKDLVRKSFLVQARKIGGQTVHAEVEPPKIMDDPAFVDMLCAGIDQDDVEEGKIRLARENPQAMSNHLANYLDEAADTIDFEKMSSENTSDGTGIDQGESQQDTVREASVKRIGKILDKETGDIFTYRRINGNSQVELIAADQEVMDTIASNEFDEMLSLGEFQSL